MADLTLTREQCLALVNQDDLGHEARAIAATGLALFAVKEASKHGALDGSISTILARLASEIIRHAFGGGVTANVAADEEEQ